MDDFYSVTEVAERLKVHFHTVRKLIQRGELRYFKIGSQIRISQEDLNNYINRQKENTREIRTGEESISTYPADLPTADQLDWQLIVNVGASGVNDVSRSKHRYLSEAYQAHFRTNPPLEKDA